MADYNFTVILTTAKGGTIKVDEAALYGYWEWPDGTEGGGLWFQKTQEPGGTFGPLELIDYDGCTYLPRSFVQAMRDNGYIVDETFN